MLPSSLPYLCNGLVPSSYKNHIPSGLPTAGDLTCTVFLIMLHCLYIGSGIFVSGRACLFGTLQNEVHFLSFAQLPVNCMFRQRSLCKLVNACIHRCS